jgi:hypothetical protein
MKSKTAMFKMGDLVLYDRFGSVWDNVSPSYDPSDYAVGIVLQIIQNPPGGFENAYAKIMKEDGAEGFFSLSYIYKETLNNQFLIKRKDVTTDES